MDVNLLLIGLAVIAGLAIIAAIALALRAIGGRIRGREGSRLAILEYQEVDKARRLVLIRRDNVEHLLLLGGGRDLVVEAGIGKPRVEANLGMPAEAARVAAPAPRLGQGYTAEPSLGAPAGHAPAAAGVAADALAGAIAANPPRRLDKAPGAAGPSNAPAVSSGPALARDASPRPRAVAPQPAEAAVPSKKPASPSPAAAPQPKWQEPQVASQPEAPAQMAPAEPQPALQTAVQPNTIAAQSNGIAGEAPAQANPVPGSKPAFAFSLEDDGVIDGTLRGPAVPPELKPGAQPGPQAVSEPSQPQRKPILAQAAASFAQRFAGQSQDQHGTSTPGAGAEPARRPVTSLQPVGPDLGANPIAPANDGHITLGPATGREPLAPSSSSMPRQPTLESLNEPALESLGAVEEDSDDLPADPELTRGDAIERAAEPAEPKLLGPTLSPPFDDEESVTAPARGDVPRPALAPIEGSSRRMAVPGSPTNLPKRSPVRTATTVRAEPALRPAPPRMEPIRPEPPRRPTDLRSGLSAPGEPPVTRSGRVAIGRSEPSFLPDEPATADASQPPRHELGQTPQRLSPSSPQKAATPGGAVNWVFRDDDYSRF